MRITTIVASVLVLSSMARACLWDYDTIRDEQRGLPGVAEILAGKWEQHSREFYQHRVTQMTKRLKSHPNDLDAYDNLAVAQEKLGDIDAAIATILIKDKLKPGQYTTHANLGTFYLHQGNLLDGIQHIRRALEINPDAHFGREKYQLQVAEYLLRAKADPAVLQQSFVTPILLSLVPHQPTTRPEDVDEVLDFVWRGGRLDNPAINAAIEGVIGMTRFGTGTSPHLYYALGDLLAARGDKHLAYRAYRRAIDYGHPAAKKIQDRAASVSGTIHEAGDLGKAIAAERAAAEAWVAAFQDHERMLIAQGKDAENVANFAAFYRTHGDPRDDVNVTLVERLQKYRRAVLPIAAVTMAGLAIIIVIRMRRRRLARNAATVEADAS